MMMEAQALQSHRILFLGEPITAEIANRLVGQLLLLDADSHDRQIDLYINSAGGSVLDGLAIVDAMRCIRAPVSTICIGRAASMAAWILAAGRKGLRQVSPEAEIMIHQMASSVAGEVSDIVMYTKRLSRLQERLVKMMTEWTGQSARQIKRDMKLERFMTAVEAKSYGIVDRVLEPAEKLATTGK